MKKIYSGITFFAAILACLWLPAAQAVERGKLPIASDLRVEAKIAREREEQLRRLREAFETRQAVEKAKLDELLNHSNSWRQSRIVREYLDNVCDACSISNEGVKIDSPLADYLRWGFQQADRLDPLRKSPHSVLDETVDDTDLEPRLRKPR